MIGRAINLGSPVNAGHPLNRGLVSWWMSLPGPYFGGTRFLDLTGKYHGTLTGGPTWGSGAGRPGGLGSIAISGGSDDVETGTITMGGTQAWLGFWAYRSATGTKQTAGLNSPGSIRLNVLWFSDNNIYFESDTGYHFVASSLTGWHRLDLVYDNALTPKIKCFLDGQLQSITVGAAVSNTTVADGPFWIGRETVNGYGSAANYDDVSLHNRAPSDDEVWQRYNQSRLGHPDTLNRYTRRSFAYAAAGGGGATVFRRGLTNRLGSRGAAA